MTTPATLSALARAWLAGEEGAGVALHDALEEAGWIPSWQGRELRIGGVCVAMASQAGVPVPGWEQSVWWRWVVGPWRNDVFGPTGQATTARSARAAASAALRRALRGE